MSRLSDRSPSAYARPSSRLAAPAEAGQRVDTPHARNAAQWRSIAYFLAGIEVLARGGQAGQAQRRTAPGADLQAIPDGNHGDNRRSLK